MTPEQTEAHGKPVALLRPPAVRQLVALLQPLSVREQTTILAQAIHEGAMTRTWADQVQFALALGKRKPPLEKVAAQGAGNTIRLKWGLKG
jgi:hypothetical protein